MAQEKNKRLLKEEDYLKLDPDKKKRAVKLSEGYYIVYPLELSEEKFKLKEELKNQDKSVQLQNRKDADAALNSELSVNDFKHKSENTTKFLINGSSVLDKDWRLASFGKDSPEMDWVKKSLNALNSVLNESISQYVDKNGIFDAEKYLKRVNAAYDEFITAAQNYVDVKDPSSIPGKRRKRRVEALLKRARQSKIDLKNMTDAIKEGAVDFDQKKPEEIEGMNAFNLVGELSASEAATVQWQNEGNSTDVYKITLKGTDGKTYYLKENLPFLNENIEGFLDRRTKQLTASLGHKNAGEHDKAEERLKDISEQDYKLATDLLTSLSDVVKNASVSERPDVEKRISGYFAHNFDDVFRNLQLNNIAADFKEDEADLTIDERLERASNSLEREALEYLKNMLIQKKQYVPGIKVRDVAKKMTAEQWLKRELNLDAKKDKEIWKAISGKTDKELETMFRVTMGKEVELFGQMSAQKMQTGTDKAAINNTATSRVAEHMGFDDVITKSKTAMVKFERRDGTTVNQLCTICEEAPGRELIDLMKEAEKTGKKIIYSSEAIRNLMRLQAIDTLTFQKDRHGRNFKCDTDYDKDGNIIVKSVKAYDNDMSFDAVTLAEAFKNGNEKRVQFLPSMTMKIPKNSALYKHVMGNYFGVDVVSPIRKPNLPVVTYYGKEYDLSKKGLQIGPQRMWDGNKGIFFADSFENRFGQNKVKIKNLTKEQKEMLVVAMKQAGYQFNENNAKEFEEKAQEYAIQKFCDVNQSMYNIWRRSREEVNEYMDKVKVLPEKEQAGKKSWIKKYLRTNLSDEKIRELSATMDEVSELMNFFDFTHCLDSDKTPVVDAHLKSMLYLHDTIFGDKLENRVLRAKNYETFKELMDPEGNLIVPNLLHYDREAYNQLKDKVEQYKDPNSKIVQKLKEIGLSQEKIDALAKRDEEIVKQLETAQEKAKLFFKAAGLEGKKPQGEFFLNKEDYKEFTKLTDFAIDPGQTYLAVDNENYLTGQTFRMKCGNAYKNVKYTELMNENELNVAKDYNKYIQEDKKRWKYDEADKSRKTIEKNNTADVAANALDGKEYIRCCMEDEIYNISHKEIKTVDELKSKMWEALTLNALSTNADAYDQPFDVKTAKKVIKPDSKAREGYGKSLDNEVGNAYKTLMNAAIEKRFEDGSYKKFDSNSFKKMNKDCLEATVKGIFKKLEDPNADVKKAAALAQKAQKFAGNWGVDLNVEKLLDKYVQKNPNAISAEKVTDMKSGLKAKPEAKPEVKADAPKKEGEEFKNEVKPAGMGSKGH